ncbi:MAG: ABC transporter permease [Methanobacteriota archaeon]
MTLLQPTWLLTWRAFVQFPRNPAILAFSMIPPILQFLLFGTIFENLTRLPNFPTDNYYEYLAPAVVLFTCVMGIANAGVALVTDMQNRYFEKLLVAPISMWAILFGRLFADGIRVYLQAAVILLLALLFDARVGTGLPGALVLLLLATLFSVVSVGMFVANIALRTKTTEAVQAVFPVFFILMFLSTAFMPEENIQSETLKTIIEYNPAQYIVLAMQDLMFGTWDYEGLGVAFGIIAGFAALLGIVTWRNYRAAYK